MEVSIKLNEEDLRVLSMMGGVMREMSEDDPEEFDRRMEHHGILEPDWCTSLVSKLQDLKRRLDGAN